MPLIDIEEVTQYPPLTSLYGYLNCSENQTEMCQYDYSNYTYIDYMPELTSETLFFYYLWTRVVPTIFGVIIMIGTIGNSLVVYVILSRRKMRSVTNILLLNLAIADIAFLLICVSFQAYKYASFNWPFGNLSCKIVQYFLYVCAYVTVWTLTAIAALRFLTVVCSIGSLRYRTKQNATMVCVMIWIVIMIVNIPTILVHRINMVEAYTYCGIQPEYTVIIFISFFVCAYAVPLTLICLLYLLIMLHLRASRCSSITSSSSKDRTAKACRLIVMVIVIFSVSWAPLHINSLVSIAGKVPKQAFYEVFRIIWHCMAYGNSLANPFIYNYASEEFRKAFREIFGCKCKEEEDVHNKKSYSGEGGRSGADEQQSMIQANNKRQNGSLDTQTQFISEK